MNELTVREYLGNKIEFKMIEGHVYANANQMANGFGGSDKLKNWKNSSNTKRYIEALDKSLGKNYPTELILVNQGGKASEQGTWIHEKLILNFARYLNVDFELWCDEQIATLIREGHIKLNSQNVEKNKRLEIMEKNANVRLSKQFSKLAEMTGNARYKEVLIAKSANVVAGEEILPLPKLEQKSYSAAELGAILGISANMVGRIANKHSLKTDRYGYLAQDKSRYSNKEVESFRYYEHSIEEFKKHLT